MSVFKLDLEAHPELLDIEPELFQSMPIRSPISHASWAEKLRCSIEHVSPMCLG